MKEDLRENPTDAGLENSFVSVTESKLAGYYEHSVRLLRDKQRAERAQSNAKTLQEWRKCTDDLEKKNADVEENRE